jgi:hypothetical protein
MRNIDQYDAPLSNASFLANVHADKCQMEQQAVARCLTFKGLKATDMEIEPTSMYGNETLQISAIKK